MKQTETQIQSAIREWLQWKGWFVIRNQQSLGSLKGLADLTAIKNSRVLWIEVKTPRGKQSDYQIEFEAAIKAHGGEYVLADSVEVVERYLGEGK
jgi:Holliday junction resolvase